MDCYGQLPTGNIFGIPPCNRFSDNPSRFTDPSSRYTDTPSRFTDTPALFADTSSINSSINHRMNSPTYGMKPNIESGMPSHNHQRNHSPVRYSQHHYPTPYRMSPNIPTPLKYYPNNYDGSYSRGYLPRPISNYSTSVHPYKDSLDKINGDVSSTNGAIEEYYRNSYYNYHESFNNYGKLNVPRNSYFNQHLGLPPHRTSNIQQPIPYHSSTRNEFYDPIAGLHQAVRNGFKDNIGLTNTYHNIYNYTPPPLSNHLKKPHFPSAYSHHHQSGYPNTFSSYPGYDVQPSNLDYYRNHHHHLLNSYADYQHSNNAQYHMYQQQKQLQQQYLANNQHIQQQNHYFNQYSNSMVSRNDDFSLRQKQINSPKISELDKNKNTEVNQDIKLEGLINEEICSMSSNYEINNDLNSEQHKRWGSLENVSLEFNKNNHDKIEQRAASSISESNTINDVNSETTAASSPLTSISSYTDSGISGCNNNIDGSNTSDGGSIEDKNDDNNLNQINSKNIEQNLDEKNIEINAKITNDNLDENEESKNEKANENHSASSEKNCISPSSASPKESNLNIGKVNQFDRVNKPLTNSNYANEKNTQENNKSNDRQLSTPSTRHSQSILSNVDLSRYQNNNNNNNISSKALQEKKLQSEYYKSHLENWSFHQGHHQGHNYNCKSLNKNNNKTNNSKNFVKSRVLESDLIPSKKSRRKSKYDNIPNESIELRDDFKDIIPLPAFQQAFGSTEIGRFSEIFQNNSPDSLYNCGTPFDYHSIDNSSPYPWETGDSLEGPHYNNIYRSSTYSSNYSDNFEMVESLKENYFNSFE